MIRAEVKLPPDTVKSLILKHYGLQVRSLEKVRAVYKVETPFGIFGFKNAEELPDLPFIANCLRKIRQNGFERMPDFLLSNSREYLIDYDGESYFMEEWLDVVEVPKESFPFLEKIGTALRDFHHAAKGVMPEQASHRFEWGKRQKFLVDAYYKIRSWKQHRSANPLEVQILDFLHYRCSLAYEYLQGVSPDSLLKTCPESAVLCHGGLHHKNIMLDPDNQIWFIDFETMVYAERVLDLAQFLQYHAAPYQWNPLIVHTFLQAYQSRLSVPVSREEWKIFFSYLAFPRRFYNRMVRYFDNVEASHDLLLKLQETVDNDMAKQSLLIRYNPKII
ncbi:phosphotransferase [Effusibacillus consociatus]|uniref:Phosphotransferase n=1 Tax=Effusibacillus consociatus TaxID=1117041 RepID=A0ABV9Q4G7_9BACL